MAIGCGLKCSKGVLISFNLLFWISGLLLLVAGVWIILDPTKAHLFELTLSSDASPDLLLYIAYLLVVIGCIIVLVGFCGCCGSLYEKRCLLITYFAFLFLLLCAELSVAVVTLVYREQFLTGLGNRLLSRFRDQYGQDSNVFTQAVDQAQYRFNCCGIYSDEDYLITKWRNQSMDIANRSRINVPLTCCVLANTDVSNAGSPISVVSRFFTGTVEEPWQHPQPKDETACQNSAKEGHPNARYKKGCMEDIELWFKQDTRILMFLGIALSIFQVIGMISSISLWRNLWDGGARMR